ncbi:MAG: hypothetical protein ACTHMF_08385 [Leifsonia sp.]|uniref:hypothetical protein n=1 Tax=Leifsonia sp. TaxID=1870902 RepID=UPI003F81C204
MSVRIHIPDGVVIDDEIPHPLPGVDIPLMAVRLGCMWTADGRDESYDGIVEWSRTDELNQLFETVLATSTSKALTQDAAEGRLPEVGERMTLRGSLSCVRSYEFEAFDLPDIRQPWRATALLSQDSDGYLIEAEPTPR